MLFWISCSNGDLGCACLMDGDTWSRPCVIPHYAKDTAPTALLQESNLLEPLQI